MFVAIFIVAVVISAFFDQQGRRHRLELEIEYEKLGKKMPPEPPKLPMLESVANIVVGLILAEIGGLSILTIVTAVKHAGQFLAQNKSFLPAETDSAAAFLAGGIALMILGVKSVLSNVRYRRNPAY